MKRELFIIEGERNEVKEAQVVGQQSHCAKILVIPTEGRNLLLSRSFDVTSENRFLTA